MAGTLTVTKTALGGAAVKYSLAWTADGSGNVNANAFDIGRGRLIQAEFVPGTPAPTANYVVTLPNPSGTDLLAGIGGAAAALSATVPSFAVPLIGNTATKAVPVFIEGFNAVAPNISAAGAGAQGTINLIVAP